MNEAYDAAVAAYTDELVKFHAVSEAMRKARIAYRAGEIGDAEFLKAKAALDEAGAGLDVFEKKIADAVDNG